MCGAQGGAPPGGGSDAKAPRGRTAKKREAQAAARQQREVQMAEEVRAELAAASARATGVDSTARYLRRVQPSSSREKAAGTAGAPRVGQGDPGERPGGPQGALGTPSLAFPWVPLALPGCPWRSLGSRRPSLALWAVI